MNTQVAVLAPQLLVATEALVEKLLHAEPIVRYHQARSQLDANTEARDLLQRLSDTQEAVRARQARGAVTQGDLESFRSVRREVKAHGTIMEYIKSQQAGAAYLQEINTEISRLLGVDFASLAGRSTC